MTTAKKEVTAQTTDTAITTDEATILSNRAAFESRIEDVNKFPDVEIGPIYTLPDKLAFWGEQLCNTARDDLPLLVNAGMEAEKIDQLDSLCGTLRYAQAELCSVLEADNQVKETVNETTIVANRIKNDLIFALRKSEELVNMVREAAKGATQSALVQKSANLASIGRKHEEELKAINFDFPLLDRAEALSALLADLLGKNGKGAHGDSERKNARLIRDKAYTMLRLLINEIREYGRYVFSNDKKHLREYMNPFSKSTKTAEEKTIEEQPEPRSAVS